MKVRGGLAAVGKNEAKIAQMVGSGKKVKAINRMSAWEDENQWYIYVH